MYVKGREESSLIFHQWAHFIFPEYAGDIFREYDEH